jgi:hypothetical protein
MIAVDVALRILMQIIDGNLLMSTLCSLAFIDGYEEVKILLFRIYAKKKFLIFSNGTCSSGDTLASTVSCLKTHSRVRI